MTTSDRRSLFCFVGIAALAGSLAGCLATHGDSRAAFGASATAQPAAAVDGIFEASRLHTLDIAMSDAAIRGAWLAAFEIALAAGEIERAAGMFARESFWRDLVAFTWNLTTVENPDGVRDMLTATLDTTRPSAFVTSEPATEAGGRVCPRHPGRPATRSDPRSAARRHPPARSGWRSPRRRRTRHTSPAGGR